MSWSLLLPFGIAFVATLGVTPVVARLARTFGYIAKPTKDRWHERPTALMGGVAIMVGCSLGVAAAVSTLVGGAGPDVINRHAAGILGAACVMFGTGVADDIWKFRPATKLVLQTIAAAVLVSSGVVFELTPWATVNILFTLFWFLGITNALNLLDNMDGVAVGVSAIASLFLAVTFALQDQLLLAGTCLALTGATAGFLPYNFHKASIFMGDSGSLLIGALLAGLGAAFPTGVSGSVVSVMFVPALIVIIPIADTTLVAISRTLAGRSVSVGGRDHTTHRLVAMGLSEPQVALVLYAFAASGGLLSLLLQRASIGYSIWIGAIFLIILFTFAAYLVKLHQYPADVVADSPRFTVVVSTLLYRGRALEVLLDLVLFSVAYYGAFLLRWDGAIPPVQLDILQRTLAVIIACYMAAFALFGVYRGVWHQASFPDMQRVAKAVVAGAILSASALVFLFREAEFSRSVLLGNALIVIVLALGVRASFKSFESLHTNAAVKGEPTLIYGAGQGGVMVLRELRANPSLGMFPVAFVDDDPRKNGVLIQGIPVIGNTESLEKRKLEVPVTRVVLGTRKISESRLRRLELWCRENQLAMYRFELQLEEHGQEDARSSRPFRASQSSP